MDYEARARRIMLTQQVRDAEAKLKESDSTGAELASVTAEAIGREADAAKQEIGFGARLLVQATLPHKKPPPDVTEFERSNGHVTINITGRRQFGLPYGTYPRLLLSWMTTEAVRTKSQELELGASLHEFMSKLHLGDNGGARGAYPRLREHMQRLFTATVSATIERNGELHDIGFRPVERFSLFWDPMQPDQEARWQSTLKLAPLFFEEITHKPVPIDLGALHELVKERSPLALDVYQWLTFRMSYLRQPTPIPWAALQLQIGSDYKATRDFKRAFLCHLKRVLELYPQARVSVERECLRLLPSKTHVPMRLINGRR